MNNFTKTESLPKTGHVNEVCKEWLVREDGALAYKLQSQEINDFYKGNRFRNAVVREDFPTALHEQIKEQENAEKHAEAYRRRLSEQEQHDKRVAKEIADKLERDIQEQQQRELLESELIAQQMQQIYVNLPPVPPPAVRDKSKPPPRPAKASILQQNSNEPSTSNGRQHNHHNHFNHKQLQSQQHQQYRHQLQLQQQHFTDTDNGYVGLLLPTGLATDMPTTPQRQKSQQIAPTPNSNHLLKLSPEKYDQLVGNDAAALAAGSTAEQHMQQHADDIELYVDPCDYASLKEIGLPMEEIKEMSKKLKQEHKDALLARRLQEMEGNDAGLTQEERDRLLAIEAQDKELAKMLQEREKAKAKRAKEKARLRKNQQKESSSSSTLCSTSNGLHCGPLLPLPQDCMSFSKHAASSSPQASVYQPTNLHAQLRQEDPIDVEAYSNPIDVLQNQRMQNGTLTNGSLTRDATTTSNRHDSHSREDDIYTLPVDSCRPGQRPASLNIGPESGHLVQHNSMTRSENYALQQHDTLNGYDTSPHMNYSKSGTFDQSSSPTPPYMPIQGTRRSNSSEDRKKKSKDKCTHQ